MLIYRMTIALLLVCLTACWSNTMDVTGNIGSHRFTFKAESVAKERVFTVRGPADYLAVTEVYPDTARDVTYKYRIYGIGIDSYERNHKSEGFGPVTYFLHVRGGKIGKIKIANRWGGSETPPVLISALRPITEPSLKTLLQKDSFTIMGKLADANREQRELCLEKLSKGLSPRPEYNIGIGFSSEIFYCKLDQSGVRRQIAECMELSQKYKLPALLGFVSWWSGTPLFNNDGQGGKFGDIEYQQVCYSPDVEIPENTDLKKLMGDRYNRHYGLSTPNQWSNTPWLTMNSPILNAYRFKRLSESVGMLKDICGGNDDWIKGIFLENEPRYWDTDCEHGNPQSNRKVLWADFNPLVIADAANDGVDLNPTDGLSDGELAWLHRNVGRYNQKTVDAINTALSAQGFANNVPIYTHSLQHRRMFPGGSINHPASEWAYANGARTGLECLWSQPSDLYRVREWGPWCNLNREENDGTSVTEHLWDLRVDYMLGGDLYNSYNWDAQKYFSYIREFVTELPIVSLPPAEACYLNAASLRIKMPNKLQAFSRIEIPVKVAKKFSGSVSLDVLIDDGQVQSSQLEPVSLAEGAGTLGIDFATAAECYFKKHAVLILHVFDKKGRPSPGSVEFTPESANDVKLILNLRAQRALSLAVINFNNVPRSNIHAMGAAVRNLN